MSASGLVNPVVEEIPDPSLPPNPHKYILYRPSVQHLLLVLATVCEEVPVNSYVLLYMAASSTLISLFFVRNVRCMSKTGTVAN
ncbi:hypothetical protein KC19_VG295300 [Ceratodon purpureus]|uniref:Uncharacterized protein n=1 Tax=Ceratodon purpureus TaxID=3225 RepID=A0A8T0HVX2_CERPU|nr:hypothetical protein KC19_VG295300 [Ceratodon purpureus]